MLCEPASWGKEGGKGRGGIWGSLEGEKGGVGNEEVKRWKGEESYAEECTCMFQYLYHSILFFLIYFFFFLSSFIFPSLFPRGAIYTLPVDYQLITVHYQIMVRQDDLTSPNTKAHVRRSWWGFLWPVDYPSTFLSSMGPGGRVDGNGAYSG